MPFLALLQIFKKSWMKEILFFLLTNTAEHVVFLLRLEYYFMHGLSNEWSKFNLSNRKQYVSINSYPILLINLYRTYIEVLYSNPTILWSNDYLFSQKNFYCRCFTETYIHLWVRPSICHNCKCDFSKNSYHHAR